MLLLLKPITKTSVKDNKTETAVRVKGAVSEGVRVIVSIENKSIR